MKAGYLSEYFEGVAIKRLSAVEADRTRSNQHEYNATRSMLAFMGRPSERASMRARFLYLTDAQEAPIVEDAFLTLYDSRENQPHRSAEYRFYFPTTRVSLRACEGDLLLIAKRRDADAEHDGLFRLLVVIAEGGSTVATQLEWLFGFARSEHSFFSVRSDFDQPKDQIGFVTAAILESIGIEIEQRQESHLDTMIERFGGEFPKTAEFSAFARETLRGIDPREQPDAALMAWMQQEECLFRTLERHVVGSRISQGFSAEHIEDFIHFSLSVQNRRKSRVGLALENHVEAILMAHEVMYARTPITENTAKPDFLFPGASQYHAKTFEAQWLSMLAVKSTCKDRWRQALAEADRIEEKHLLTLEPAISLNQTNEMRAKRLQLVVPAEIHTTYATTQQDWLLSVDDFLQLVADRQKRSSDAAVA